jgi:hypothetical protein
VIRAVRIDSEIMLTMKVFLTPINEITGLEKGPIDIIYKDRPYTSCSII